MKRSSWPNPAPRRRSRWVDLALAALLGAILIAQAVDLTASSPADGWTLPFAH